MLKSQFTTTIGGYQPVLAVVVRNGVGSYTIEYINVLDVHTKRSQACLMHDHMIRTAQEILPRPDFTLVRAGQRRVFNFRDQLLIQFKRLAPNLTTSNYPTPMAELFEDLGEVSLPGMDAALPLINVGYVLKPFTYEIEGIFVTQTINRRPAWILRLDEPEEPQQPVLSILPPNAPRPTPPSRIRRQRDGDSTSTTGSA